MPLINRTNSKKFAQGLITQVRQRYRSVYPQIKAVVKDFVSTKMREEFYKNETVDSCINGILKGELGLQEPAASMEAILQRMLSTLTINVTAPKDQKGVLRITIQAVRDDLNDLIGLAAASQDWTDRTGSEIRGEPLPWLEWLLVEGNSVIISDYVLRTDRQIGRSGEQAIMQEAEGKFWKVPAQYQGTLTDNFILDIITLTEKAMRKNLWETVRPVLARLS